TCIAQLYTMLESTLFEICEIHHRRFEKAFSIRDIRGQSDWEKIKLYLNRNNIVNLAHLDDYGFLNDIRKLRNKIVHNNSTIKKTDPDYRSIEKLSEKNFNMWSFPETPEQLRMVFDSRHFIESIYE